MNFVNFEEIVLIPFLANAQKIPASAITIATMMMIEIKFVSPLSDFMNLVNAETALIWILFILLTKVFIVFSPFIQNNYSKKSSQLKITLNH